MPLPDEIASQLPEDIRANESLAPFNDVGSLAKSYLETKSLVGSSIRLPGKESKPEDIEKWAGETGAKLKETGYTVAKLGDVPPATPDGYKFEFEGVDPEVVNTSPIINMIRTGAHKYHLNQAQAAGIVDFWEKEIVPKLAETQKSVEFIEDAGQEAVNKILQSDFKGDLTERMDLFNKGLITLKQERADLPAMLEGTAQYDGTRWIALKNHPAMVWLVGEVARMRQQDFGGNLAAIPEGESLETINDKIAAVRNDAKLSDNGKGEKLDGLYKIKNAILKRGAR